MSKLMAWWGEPRQGFLPVGEWAYDKYKFSGDYIWQTFGFDTHVLYIWMEDET